jgi:hypothetical protein
MIGDGGIVKWAAEAAMSLLLPLGNRWLHVQGVVETAQWVGQTFDEGNCSYLLAAAYLHDIGYAPALQKTGFHPLDGACYVRSYGYERLASLVAHHSEARFEAQLRGFDLALSAFPREPSAVADALVYCDMTTGPTGLHLSLQERLADIFCRYGETDIVTQALRQARPYLTLAVGRMQRRLRRCGLTRVPPTD